MWHTIHFLNGHSAVQLPPAPRAQPRHAWHALLTKLANPAITQPALLAAATILFVLACLGLTLVGGPHAH